MLRPHRIAGSLALDFANTVYWRDTDRQSDLLDTREGLRNWASAVGLAQEDAAVPNRRTFDEALALRDAVGTIGAAFAHGDSPGLPSLNQMRDVAAATLARAHLDHRTMSPVFAPDDGLLGSVAWSAMDLFGGSERTRIKECPFHDCRWLFVDRSKNGSRRWCDMGTCDNRAKKIAMIAH